MRLFIAINFSGETRARLAALCGELRDKAGCGKFSEPDNLHLTLAFLGECDARQTAAAKSVMDAVQFESFAVTIDRVGRFKRGGGDIWWAGVREHKSLSTLQADLTDRLAEAGFQLEKRRYSPHVTLAREVVANGPQENVKPDMEPFDETVLAIELMKSERIRGKLIYTAIHKKVCGRL